MAPQAELTRRAVELEPRVERSFDRLKVDRSRLRAQAGELFPGASRECPLLCPVGAKSGHSRAEAEQAGTGAALAGRSVEQMVGGS